MRDLAAAVTETARAARDAAMSLAGCTRAAKDAALRAMAARLLSGGAAVLDANAADLARARATGSPAALLDRLALDSARITAMAEGLRTLASLPDPVGEVVRGSRLPNGLEVRQVRVPLGVVAVVYEARPNVTVDAAGLCLKSGNAVLLRGSSSARASNAALIDLLRAAAVEAGLPESCLAAVPGEGHEAVNTLIGLRGLVDLVIPRGGAGLIDAVVAGSQVPVVQTGVGNCHIYVDATADLAMARRILLDAKTSRPSVCNAVETLLVHEAVSGEFLTAALPALAAAGVTVHGDVATGRAGAAVGVPVVPATEGDWATEYLSLDLAVRVVADLETALGHIRTWGTGHTEAVVTADLAVARRFCSGVDAAAVMVNASTRFTDGEQFGLGAEVGISTQKLHARGPMGLADLTTTTWIVTGDGQVRG